jgi:hypothetical protein
MSEDQSDSGAAQRPEVITLDDSASKASPSPQTVKGRSSVWSHFTDKEVKKGKEVFVAKACRYCQAT